jgi:hypothetical protein
MRKEHESELILLLIRLLKVAKKIYYLLSVLNFEIRIETIGFNDVLVMLAIASCKTHDVNLFALRRCLTFEERINAKFEQRN